MPGMAGGGLPDAEQQILADASVYLDELQKVKRQNKTVEESNKALGESFGKLAEQITKIERSIRDIGRSQEVVRGFVEMQKAIDAAYEANQRFTANPAEIEDHTHLIQEATKAYQDAAGATEFFTKATTRHIEETIRADEATDLHIQTTNELTAARQKAAAVARDLADAHRQVNNEIIRARDIAQARGIDVGTGYLPGPAFGAGGGGRAEGGLAASTIRAIAAEESTRRFSSFIPAALAAGGGILGAGGLITALGTGGRPDIGRGLSAISGGFGAVGRALGPVFDMGGGPTAADTSRVVTGFIRRWYPAAHWAMMLTNELLATVGPAVTAGGMGALTGVQGFEQLIPRGQAIFRTSESLGDSLGKTTGQAWGLKTAYLQNAQDLATGMATQLAGAAVNIIRSPGTGGAFAQLGLNTDAMFSRFAATLTQHFQKGGLGSQLSNMVTGGTGYLQQFGDVLSNLGNTFLNVAPNLPGVGGDLLGLLSGGTGALASGTHWLNGMLGPLLAGEAGMRWGPAIVGTAARGIGRVGRIPGLGFLGEAPRAATAADALALGVREGAALPGIGLAGALGGMGTLPIGLAAASAYVLSKGYTYQTPEQQLMGRLQQQTGQLGFAAGYPSLISAMQQAAGVSPSDNRGATGLQNIARGFGGIFGGIGRGNMSELWHGIVQEVHGGIQTVPAMFGQGMGRDPGNFTVAQQALQQFAQTAVNALNSGSQIQKQWQQLSGSAISMGKATDIATMAQLQLGTAFQKNGMLSDQAKTMIGNLYAGYAPMHMNSGMFGAAVGAQTAMAGLQHTQIASVNQAFDQLSQLATGGGATAATYFGLLGATPVSFKRGGLKFPAPPDMKKMALALGSFTSPGGAAAWNRLTNQQTGLFPALEGQLNWLREAQTMGSLTAGQTTGMASYEMAQLLPSLKGSPAALSMLSMYAQQYGGPGFAPGTSAGAMFRGLSHFFGRTGVSNKGYNRLMTLGTEGLTNIGADANAFVQQIGSGIGDPMATAVFTHGEDLMKNFMSTVGHKGTARSLSQLAGFMFGSGTPLAGARSMVKYAAGLSGASSGLQAQLSSQLGHLYAKLQVQADVSQARAAINNLTHVSSQPKVSVKAEVAAAQAAINAIKGKDIPVSVKAQGIAAVQQAISAIHGKTVTITINTVNRLITQVIGMGTPAGGVAPATFAGSGAPNMRITRGQSGFRVPGYGGGDIYPAMLEPGEAVVPKHLVPALSGFLGAHKVPGFADGGFVGQAAYGPGAYWGMGSKMAMWNPALSGVLQAAMRATQPHLPPYISGPVHADAIHAAMATAGASGGSGGSGKGVGPTLAQLNAEIRKAWQTLDKLYAEKDKGGLSGAALANLNAQIKNFWKTVLDPLYAQKDALTGGRGHSVVSSQSANLAKIAKEFTIHLSGDIAKEVKGSAAAKNIATALISKLTQEVQYAKGVQASMKAGLNLAGMDVTPGTGGGTVFEQMQSYSKSLSSFSGDLSKLGKGHLNKELMKQIVAAGPVQGDALAQSILNDYGGIGAVNKEYAKITKQANKLGVKAAELQYGGHLSDDLRKGSVSTQGININVNLNKGAGGTLDLTPEQVAAIVAKVQAALLKQAKKNNKTGVKAHGKSA